jgi:hypothetical protein
LNQGGSINEEIDLAMTFQEHLERATFAVCDLGDKTAVIGHTWLFQHNPEIDWRTGNFTSCPPDCYMESKKGKGKARGRMLNSTVNFQVFQIKVWMTRCHKKIEDQKESMDSHPKIDPEDRDFVSFLHNEQHINATSTVSQKLAESLISRILRRKEPLDKLFLNSITSSRMFFLRNPLISSQTENLGIILLS